MPRPNLTLLSAILHFFLRRIGRIFQSHQPPHASSSVYNTTVVVLAMIGKVAITGGYQAITFFAGELFPTEVRSRGISSSFIISRIGSILSLFITDLMVSFGLNRYKDTYLAHFFQLYLPEFLLIIFFIASSNCVMSRFVHLFSSSFSWIQGLRVPLGSFHCVWVGRLAGSSVGYRTAGNSWPDTARHRGRNGG